MRIKGYSNNLIITYSTTIIHVQPLHRTDYLSGTVVKFKSTLATSVGQSEQKFSFKVH